MEKKTLLAKLNELEALYGPKPGDKCTVNGCEAIYLGKSISPTTRNLLPVYGFKGEYSGCDWLPQFIENQSIKAYALSQRITSCAFAIGATIIWNK
jgi:hypothetical protein